MDVKFYKEALFGGMTSNGFKLGTVLSGGWFWLRNKGCMMLYRGEDFSVMDFENILAVFEIGAEQIEAPAWLEHKAGGRYLYAVRRANICGDEEKGLAALSVLEFDDEGNLEAAGPNRVFGLSAEVLATGEAELVWFYNPLGQKSEPVSFKIYSNGGIGEVDFESEIGVVNYKGKGFYRFKAQPLSEGRYLFAVRAENKSGKDDGMFATRGVEIDFTQPQQGKIISAEAM